MEGRQAIPDTRTEGGRGRGCRILGGRPAMIQEDDDLGNEQSTLY